MILERYLDPFITTSQHTLSTDLLNTSSQHTLSSYLLNAPSLFLHSPTEYWKRRQKYIAMEYGMIGYELIQQERPQFDGEYRPSVISGLPGHQPMEYLTCIPVNI